MFNRVKKSILFIIIVGTLVPAFQNCSKVSFATQDPSVGGTGDPDDLIAATETFSTKVGDKSSDKADILFVVDESVSMDAITTQMGIGFDAIAGSQYPSDTRMAVTNMAPAMYANASLNQIDYSQSFVNKAGISIVDQPGFIQLVTGSTINSFLSAHPEMNSKFAKSGCNDAWFAPTQKNASGTNSCLSAHTQIALQGTGVEAGVIAFDQLVRRSGSRIFREGAVANVIFVSDTHDAGDSYYGLAGAKSQIPTFSEINQTVMSRNPGIKALKFHGIVPLPTSASDAQLANIKVIGNLPSNSKVSGEDLHDFSYLPFIAASGGAAMHPTGNNWVNALSEVIAEVSSVSAATVTLAFAAVSIDEVIVEGVKLSKSEYDLLADHRTIVIHPKSSWPETIDIKVTYSHN